MPDAAGNPKARRGAAVADGLAQLAEQLTNRVIRPLDLVILTRSQIRQVLEQATQRGRITRSDADELALELFSRGRGPESLLEKPASGLPIAGYDELTARQITQQLEGLRPPALRRLREYERKHANRKSVLAAIERALG